MDPASDTYVVLLANSVHPRGSAPISPLRGVVATEVAKALGVGTQGAGTVQPTHRDDAAMNGAPSSDSANASHSLRRGFSTPGSSADLNQTFDLERAEPRAELISGAATQVSGARPGAPGSEVVPAKVLTGIDVLEADGFAEFKAAAARHGGKLRMGLLTNQTGLDAQGRTDDRLLRGAGGGIELVKLFSPEHGIFGAKDSEVIGQEMDAASGLKVTSLYGPKDADKRPKPEDLKDLDAVVIDLQDAGVRFYTYETVVGYFLEADACEKARDMILR